MPDEQSKITIQDLKKMLDESHFSDELKKAYHQVLEQMTEKETAELIKLLEADHQAGLDYDEQKSEKLARLNVALKKHLKNTAQKEEGYASEQFEKFGKREDETEIKGLEEEIERL